MTEAGGQADAGGAVFREAVIPNREGMHARPVMRFVDLASTFECEIQVRNVTRQGDRVDGKSAMQMMLLEAVRGHTIRIDARGADARRAVDALAALIDDAFGMGPDAVEPHS
jgi:phosphocarrier protein